MAELELFPDDEPAVFKELAVAEIDNLVPDAAEYHVGIDPSFLKSVRTFGVLEPILLIEARGGKTYKCAAGRRRIKAAKLAERSTIPARIFPFGWTVPAVLTLVENEQRSRNTLAEWKAVEELIAQNRTEQEIIERTGILQQRLEQLLTLRNLIDPLRAAFEIGQMKPSVALLAAKQKPVVQRRLVKVMERNNGRLKAKDVVQERKVARQSAVASLPKDIFGNADDWKEQAIQKLGELRAYLAPHAPSLVESVDRLMVDVQQTVQAEPVPAQEG